MEYINKNQWMFFKLDSLIPLKHPSTRDMVNSIKRSFDVKTLLIFPFVSYLLMFVRDMRSIDYYFLNIINYITILLQFLQTSLLSVQSSVIIPSSFTRPPIKVCHDYRTNRNLRKCQIWDLRFLWRNRKRIRL